MLAVKGMCVALRGNAMRSVSAGLVVVALGAGSAISGAKAQGTVPDPLRTDAASRQSAKDKIKELAAADYANAMKAYRAGDCRKFATYLSILRSSRNEGGVRAHGKLLRVFLSAADRQEIISYNLSLWNMLPRECPPKTGETASAFGTSQTTVAISGGASQATVPQINGGTKFDPVSGTEIPITKSAQTLTGGSAGVVVTTPTPDNVLWGDYFYISGSGSWFDGSSNDSVPVGATGVAQTYIVPNPVSGSTGILAGATGQSVQINSDGRVIDVSFGVKNDGLRLPFFNGTANGSQFSGQRVNWHTIVGAHYRNLNLTHTINQQSLTFSDLNSRIEVDQNSNFFGARFGIGVSTSPPGLQPGFIGGIDAFVSPGWLSTSASASQLSNCGPCGVGSPEFAVSLRQDFDSSNFSVILGASANVGYRINRNVTISIFGTVEHMTDVPYFNVPTTPTQQPINFNGRDSVTNAAGGFVFRITTGG